MKHSLKISSVLFYGIILLMVVVCAVSLINALSWINKPFAGFLIYKVPHVGSMSSPDWPGIRAGLKLMDKIVSADGQPLRESKDLLSIISQKPPGTLVHYAVESEGQTNKIAVPSSIFSLYDFFTVFFMPFLGGFALFVLGVIVYVIKPEVHTSWVFFFFCLIMGIYMVTGFEIQSTYFLVPIHYFAVPLGGALFLHIGLIFPEKKKIITQYPWLEYLIYLPALLLALVFEISVFTSQMVSGSTYPFLVSINIKAITSYIRLFNLLCVAGVIILVLHSMAKTSSGIVRQRGKMILFGATIGWLLPAMFMLSAHFMKVDFPWNFLPLLGIFFPIFIGYSIVRHNLFDAETIIRRTVGYVIVTSVVAGVYILVSISLNFFLGKYAISQSKAFPIVFTLIIILIFNPLRNRIQSLVDRIFFRKEYDYGKIIDKISNAMTSMLDLGQILKQMTRTFMEDMFINTSSVMLLNPAGNGYQVCMAEGEKKNEIEKMLFKKEQPLVKIIEESKKELTRYDIIEDPQYRTISQDCLRDFEALNASLMMPLIFQDKVIGLLNLGEKKSGKFYNREDIDLLRTMANQGAVAIENAKLMEENIQKSRMEEELKIAHDIQLSMLPDKAPVVEGLSIVARSIPAREVGGDFYDFIEITDDGSKRLGIVVGDVSGKAVSGALVMAASRSIFRVLTETHQSVEDVMNRGNARLHRDVKKGMFVALLYAVLDPKERTLTFSNAGQVQPILFSAEKSKAEYVETEGDRFPLGIVKKCHYEATRVTVSKGDILVFYTDGIVEAVNEKGELYGFERFLASIEEGRNWGADKLLEKLLQDVMQFVGKTEQHDDLTAVVVKVE
ncbi:MAG: GAF domain-containing protein [Deltaproteobacteria bacterium]|nr:GAF domain-containing protein [Deltaproteobacteria bacterium]